MSSLTRVLIIVLLIVVYIALTGCAPFKDESRFANGNTDLTTPFTNGQDSNINGFIIIPAKINPVNFNKTANGFDIK